MNYSNISELLPEVSQKYASKTALVKVSRTRAGTRKYDSITFAELDAMTNSFACEFRKHGIAKGTKVLVMQKPGFEFITSVFAILKLGAVPILIDPGMGLQNLLSCIQKTSPIAFFGIAKAHWLSLLFPGTFRSVKKRFSADALTPPNVIKILPDKNFKDTFEIEETAPDDTAAIVFTTGSTGPPKGVVYTHRIYLKQVEILSRLYGVGPDEIDMPCFPLFALFSAVLGMKAVIPDFNPSLPAKADPAEIAAIIQENNITFSFASPALWRNLAKFCIKNNLKFKTLKKALMAGAPVDASLHADMKKILADGGESIVPYGATEALPIANFTGTEMLSETASLTAEGHGFCVGKPIPDVKIAIMKPQDGPVEFWDEKNTLPPGQIGEIIVSGPIVTPEYYNEPEHNANAKMRDKSGNVWHRIGDVGYFDSAGRLWFLGRKAHVVNTLEGELYSVSCEAIFDQHPKVFRSALVGLGPKGKQIPVIILEPIKGEMPHGKKQRQKFIDELLELGRNNPATSRISQFLFHPAFPVDIRHNAKIFREKLAEWAKRKIQI